MNIPKNHFRHILLYYYRKGKNAAQAQQKLCAVYGEDCISIRQCQTWFSRFRLGKFELEDEPRNGRPLEADDEEIKMLVKENRSLTTREIGKTLNLANSTVHTHLKSLGYVSKLDVVVPHCLTEKNLIHRVEICDLLLKREANDPFLRRIVTGDEKWITYRNFRRKRSWCKSDESPQAIPKRDIHEKKVMLSVWWDWQGVIFFELMPKNQTINSKIYCDQLDKLNENLKLRRPVLTRRKGPVFHHDNATPHTSLTTRQKLMDFCWDILPHPPYSPDLAPSDFHLFRSLQNSLDGRMFDSHEDVYTYLTQFFANKDKKFYADGIFKLPGRWQKVLEQNGQYITD